MTYAFSGFYHYEPKKVKNFRYCKLSIYCKVKHVISEMKEETKEIYDFKKELLWMIFLNGQIKLKDAAIRWIKLIKCNETDTNEAKALKRRFNSLDKETKHACGKFKEIMEQKYLFKLWLCWKFWYILLLLFSDDNENYKN